MNLLLPTDETVLPEQHYYWQPSDVSPVLQALVIPYSAHQFSDEHLD